MSTGVELAYLPESRSIMRRTSGPLSTYGAVAIVLSGLAATTALLAMIPLMPLCFATFALIVGSLVTAAVSRSGDDVELDEIASPALRDAYRDVVNAACKLAAMTSSDDTEVPVVASLRQRARLVVAASGRLARRTNRAYEHTSRHAPSDIAADIEHLRARAEQATDEVTKRTLLGAAATRGRELATINTMIATRDRVHARLERAAALLRACTASAVASASENAEFALDQTTMDDRVDELATELAVVEETVAETAQALTA